ncbi:MAG: hypothetical protein ACTS8P_01790, partial [Arsenophonus sp. NC-XBC3-MAG3]
MLDCKTIEINYISPATLYQMDMLKTITATQILEKLDDINCNLLLQFLAENGYFCVVNVTTDNMTGSKTARVTLPNHEIYLELSSNVFDETLFKRWYSFDADNEVEFTRAMLSLRNDTNFRRLHKMFNRLFKKYVNSTHPTASELSVCLQSILKGKNFLLEVKREPPFFRSERSKSIANDGAEILMVRHD